MLKANIQIIIDDIIKDIEKGAKRNDIVTKYCKKIQKSARTIDTYWKIAKEQIENRQEMANKALNKVYVKKKISAVKNGLKSKFDRELELQVEIDMIDKQLKGEVEFTFMVGNKVNKSHNGGTFMVPIQILNDLRVKKLQYYSELNKMEGDYAPLKTEKNIEGLNVVVNIG